MTLPPEMLEGEPRRNIVHLLTDEEMHPELLMDVKAFLRKIAIPRRRYLAWLYDQMEASNAVVLDADENPVTIIDLKDWEQFERDNFDLWIRDWSKLPERHITPRIHDDEVRERIRLLVTALRMIFVGSFAWISASSTDQSGHNDALA